MPCKWVYRPASRLNPARCCFRVQCRASTAYVSGRILRGDALGPIRTEANQTFRLREEEEEEGETRDLPLSPFLDPVIVEKKLRWQEAKKQPRYADFTPFQKKIWETPYAQTLASPIRQCRATLISLPIAFLTSLHVRPHPTTNDPWLLPVSLSTDKKPFGPPVRFIGRQVVAAHLGRKRAWERALYARVHEKLGPYNMNNLVWREDMPEFILHLMRKRLVDKLGWSFRSSGRLTPVRSPRTEDIDSEDDVSCILLFSSLRASTDDIQNRANQVKQELDKWASYTVKNYSAQLDPHASSNVTHKSPHWYTEPLVPRLQPRSQFPELEFHTTLWRGRRVPVYSLIDLLGEESARVFIKGSTQKGKKCVIMKRTRMTTPAQILLMQLQAFMARCGP